MNLLEVFSPKEHETLLEKLGNLSKLGMPKLLQSLKQKVGQHRDQSNRITPLPKKGAKDYYGRNENKFVRDWGADIGSESEIIDGGEVKKGLPDIRKGYKSHGGDVRAFALYIDNKPIAFARFDDYALSGPSRAGVLAYDLTPFQAKLDEIDKVAFEKKSDWEKQSHRPTKATTVKSVEKQDYNYYAKNDEDRYAKYKEHHIGELSTTSALPTFFELLKEIGGKITVKYVLVQDNQKRRDRNANPPITKQDVKELRNDLMLRLKKYKLSKKPTAENIMEFMKAAEKGTGIIQFAGSSYTLEKKDSYNKLTPLQILHGTSFDIEYSSVQPGYYETVSVTYSFDKTTSLLMPISVKWSEKGTRHEEVLNRPIWLKKSGIHHENKDATIKTLLTLFKAEKYNKVRQQIDVLRKEGIDWPEFKTLEKSIDIEMKKAAEKANSD